MHASFKCIKEKVGHFGFPKITLKKKSQNCVKRDFSFTNSVIFWQFWGEALVLWAGGGCWVSEYIMFLYASFVCGDPRTGELFSKG